MRALQFLLGGALVEGKELEISREQVLTFNRRRVGSLSDALGRLGLDLAALALEEMLELEPRRVRRLTSKNALSDPRARATRVTRLTVIPGFCRC